MGGALKRGTARRLVRSEGRAGGVRPPSWLPERARAYWARLVRVLRARKMWREDYREMLAVLAWALAAFEEAVVRGDHRVALACARQIRDYARGFGLSPLDLQRLDEPTTELDAVDRFVFGEPDDQVALK